MDKNIGFRRNILLVWLDAVAAFSSETNDAANLRSRLEPVVEQQIQSKENRRMAIDILLNIWLRTGEEHPYLRDEAVQLFAQSEVLEDRIWLHYGLTMLYYDFFRRGVVTIGQMSKYADVIASKEIKKRMFAELGQAGALDKAVERIIFSLRDWGILRASDTRYAYVPCRQQFHTSSQAVERWMLAAALTAHPAQELPFGDLVRLPELFPFRFATTVDELRQYPGFEVHRQGLGWDMVRFTPPLQAKQAGLH